MEQLHLPDNIKVHYAGAENLSDAKILNEMGINYCLYTAYPFVDKKIRNKKYDGEVPFFLCNNMKHVIQDSGLFSLLFGKEKDKTTKDYIYKWYDALIEWTLEYGQGVTCVEVDAQKIIGTEETWKLRERMRRDLPNNRIINVFHIEDGMYGLDRLIEYSDYLAIGSRVTSKGLYSVPLTKYIKLKKPSIDIHMLGLTHFTYLDGLRYCTSCDSVTWLNARRFGELSGGIRTDFLDWEKIKHAFGQEKCDKIKGKSPEGVASAMIVNLELWKHKTVKTCGNQDYKWIINQ